MNYKRIHYNIPQPTKAGLCRCSCPFKRYIGCHIGWSIVNEKSDLYDHTWLEYCPGPKCPWGKKEK